MQPRRPRSSGPAICRSALLAGLLAGGGAAAAPAPRGAEPGDTLDPQDERGRALLATVRPKRLASTAVLVHEEGDQLYIVDDTNTLWTGMAGDMERRFTLPERPTGLRLGAHLLAWSVQQRGLVAETRVYSLDLGKGTTLGHHEEAALLLDSVSVPGLDALLFPGALIPLDSRAPLPLPPASTGRLRADAGRLVVTLDGRDLPLDLATLRPLEALPAPRDGVEALIDLERQVARAAAALQGDAVRLQSLGVRGEAAVEALRPREAEKVRPFRTRDESKVSVPPALLGPGVTVVLHAPSPALDLGPWMVEAEAPACHARLVLAPTDVVEAAWWSAEVDRLLALHPGGCGLDTLVAAPGDIGAHGADGPPSGLWFVDAQGRLLGSHEGTVTAPMARFDLARARPDRDPLRTLAELPELRPEWVAGPGAAEQIALDVDGTWVAGVGWDLLRGTPDKLRLDRVPLSGPVRGVAVLPDGRFRAESAGQPVIVDVERRRQAWGQGGDVATRRAADGALDPRPWTVEGGVASRPHPTKKGQRVKVTLPVPITRGQARGDGLICETRLGLIGLNGEGVATWRVTELSDWVLTGGFLLAATPTGLRAYLLPG